MKPHLLRTPTARPAAPRVLVSLPDLRGEALAAGHASSPARATDSYAVRADTHDPTHATAGTRHARRTNLAWQRLHARKLRFDGSRQGGLGFIAGLGPWMRQAFSRSAVIAALQGRAIWGMALTAIVVDVMAIYFLGQPAPTPTESLPPIPTMPAVSGPALHGAPSALPGPQPLPSATGSPIGVPTPAAETALPPAKAREPMFPANSPRLGEPADQLPWENWSPRQAPVPADSNESAANRPARLPGAADTPPEYRTAQLPKPERASPPADAAPATGKARLLGTIRKPLPEINNEHARPGLY
ncbi:MAG: hypothetical protein JSS27_11145 [Planctomycetes bacterium]|nr:hypothetical protein [Planctomycetota bacterium]